jgi:hypothetical protein
MVLTVAAMTCCCPFLQEPKGGRREPKATRIKKLRLGA